MACHTPRLSRTLAAFPLLLLLAGPMLAEDGSPVKILGESAAPAIRLSDARKKLDEHKWSEAIEALQTILNTAGDDLVAVTPTHSVRAGRLCQIQLAALPAEALGVYRRRYENQARKKLQRAQAERDVAELRKLVEDAFCTRAAEKALDLLGDLAFERGRFAEAEEWWRLLAPLPDGRRDAAVRGLSLVYPDLSLDPARLQAKQLLARLFRGSDSEWTAALDTYGKRHGKAEGTLAGRKGRYIDLLRALAAQRKKRGDTDRDDWLTFGGDPSRGRVIPASEDILDRLSALCEGPSWTFSLEKRALQEEGIPSPAVNAEQARTLAFYPVIAGHHVLVADARYVTAFDVRNGKSEEWYDVAKDNWVVRPNLKLPALPDLRYTLTVAEDNVYVRLGPQDLGRAAPAPPAPPRNAEPKPQRDKETFLTTLRLRAEDRQPRRRREIRGIVQDNAFFEGSPLVGDGLLWVASTRYHGEHCLTAIDCYTSEDTTAPPLRWRRDVCETPAPKAGQPRYRHHLLTRAGSQIVYCTHNGAVVSIDALTGRTSWAVRYPRRTSGEEGKLRDVAPVLFAAGRLYVAPADSDNLLCLDPATGCLLWELEPVRVPGSGDKLWDLEPVNVVHLLGVGQGQLIFTTSRGLRAVGADDGSLAWSVPDSGTLTPAGRGLLIGDLVLFPTTQQRGSGFTETVVYALRQSDGRPADDPAKLHRLPAGNLAYANGCLAVADQRTLTVFVPQRLLLNERKPEAGRHPDSSAALRERQRVLLEMARDSAETKRWDDADTAAQRAIAVPLSPRGRLHALLRVAQIWKDAGQPARARAIWETILGDAQLRQIQVIDRNGKPASASACAAVQVGQKSRLRLSAKPQAAGKPDLHAPPLPLFRAWHARLKTDEWILAGWQECDPHLLLTGSPDGRFTCRLTSTGDIRWQHRLPFALRWAGSHADAILAGGEGGVACLRRDNGEILWHFPAPAPGRYPRAPVDELRVVLDPQQPEPLSDFRLAAGRLFFLQGQRRLFALDAETGVVLWDRWAPDGALRLSWPRSCFSPCYHASAETVLLQASGHRWLLDAATGQPLHEAADSRDLWQRSPLQVDERTLCVISDSRHLRLLDACTGKCLWTHRSDASTTLSGEMPSVLGRGDVLIYVQPANVGYYLQRLDRATGNPLWPRPRVLTAKSLDLSAWTFDSQALYGIEDRYLIARSLTDGKVLWRRALPSADVWQARRIGDYLAVFACGTTAARFQLRSPLGAVQWDLGSLLAPDAISPVSWYDPKTGQLVQRLNFRIESPLRTAFATRRMPHESGRVRIMRTSSLLASERGPVIQLASPRPYVALGGEVWGLTAARSDKDAAASAER
ncbi:MAG TPA: PQQ-binding-like beta-propeller repeat protein [Gemmataceae bacterium]|nr:PQQ-binding-like beta-propeller repeat protein [Gemmataceae bacterium]